MKIQIEYHLIETSPETVIQFNYILKSIKAMQTLLELKNWLNTQDINLFRFGSGANHCWVKQYDSNGTLSNERLFLITE